MRRLPVVLVATLAVSLGLPAAFSLAPLPQNDAGSGGDAPNAPGPGAPIASGVAYVGQLAAGDLHDWYAFSAPAGARVEARVLGGHGCYEIAGSDGVALAHGCALGPFVEGATIVATIPAAGTWYFHYENVPLDVYRFSIGINAAAAAPVVGPAPPQVDPVQGVAQNDAGSGGDAPDARSGDLVVATGVVHSGFLDGVLDASDWYAFPASAGDEIEIRARTTGVHCIYLHDPSGVEIDFTCNIAGYSEALDPRVHVTTVSTGLHYLRVSYFDAQFYRFGIGVNAPAPAIMLGVEPTTPPPPAAAWPAPPAEEWIEAARSGEPLDLVVDGRVLRLSLRENGALVAPFVVLPPEAAGVVLLEGSAAGDVVRATIHGDDLVGHVFLASGTISLGTQQDGRVIAYHERSYAGLTGLGMPFDVEEGEPRGGSALDCIRPIPARVANPLGLALGWPERTFDLAYAVDDDFVARNGASWATRALAHANSLDGFYASQIGLRIRVADLHAHAAGAIEGASTSELIDATAWHYASHHGGLAREGTHLFTGIDLSGVVGQANCIGGAGDADIAYTVSRATDDPPLIFFGLRWFPDTDLKIAAHELGHILSAHHHYSNCASERLTGYDPIETFDICTLMINDIGLASMQFSTVNKLSTRGWSEHSDL